MLNERGRRVEALMASFVSALIRARAHAPTATELEALFRAAETIVDCIDREYDVEEVDDEGENPG